MTGELGPAIALLEKKLEDLERNAAQLRGAISVLRSEAGMPPLPEGPTNSAGGSAVPSLSQIGPDTFYGKKLQTAVREYLEMRKLQGLGPAKPREIYEAITAGGYSFEASSPDVAMIGLRALLRKRTNFFHKLPNGTYGLTAWYPHAKAPKVTPPPGSSASPNEDDDDEESNETATAASQNSDDAAAT